MFRRGWVLRQIQPNLLLQVLPAAKLHLVVLRVTWAVRDQAHRLVRVTVDVNGVIVAPFEFLVDPIESLEVLRAHHLMAPATLVTHRVRLAEQHHRVDPPRLVAIREDLRDALECAFFLVLFIIVTVFALARRPGHIVVLHGFLRVSGLEVLFFKFIVFN